MTPEQIEAVVANYRKFFEERNVPKIPMDDRYAFGQVSSEVRMAHAHYLLDGILKYSKIPGKERKTGSHLTAVQMILSFENFYTLRDLKNHNR